MTTESPLEKVLRLAQVQGFERRSPRGREEHVRSFNRSGYISPEKWAAGQKEWTARGEAAWKRPGLPGADRSMVAAHEADARKTAALGQTAPLGTSGHAEELRSLASEAEGLRGRNYVTLRDTKEGMPTAGVASDKAGTNKVSAPESDLGRVLRRSATMIDRGQPSMARLHAQSVRDFAKTEAHGNPGMLARMNAAADRLEQLPEGKGLAAMPPKTEDFQRRTAAARRYAKSTEPKDKSG